MPTFVLTVRSARPNSQGLRLSPGFRLSQATDRGAVGSMLPGATLELRRPDGTTVATSLVTFGISVRRGEDGALYLHDDPADPEIELTLPADLAVEEVPTGTEVWLME